MNKKAELFNQLLEEGPENVFNIQEAEDELHSVIYHSKLNVNGKDYFFIVVFDDTDTTVVNLLLDEENVTSENYGYVVDFCNTQNRSTRVMRFYVDTEDRVMLDCCLTAREEFFDPAAVATLIDAMAEAVSVSEEALQKALRCEE